MRTPHRCPNCGEPVSAFAAGCALCGAELDPRRAQGPRTIAERMRSAAYSLKPRARVREKNALNSQR
jgi:predicted amidophosphoribosyltransferase